MSQETQTGALYQPRGVGWGGEEGGSFKREGIYVKKKKKGLCGTSQVVQWLRLHASTEEGMGLIPGQRT